MKLVTAAILVTTVLVGSAGAAGANMSSTSRLSLLREEIRAGRISRGNEQLKVSIAYCASVRRDNEFLDCVNGTSRFNSVNEAGEFARNWAIRSTGMPASYIDSMAQIHLSSLIGY